MTEQDKLIYGKDPTERIVGMHPIGSPENIAMMRVYFRDKEDNVTHEDIRYWPYFHTSRPYVEPIKPGKSLELKGEGFYKYLCYFETRQQWFDAYEGIKKATRSNYPRTVYRTFTEEQQFLMQSGKTMFMGMTYDDIHRLAVDIEVYTPYSFPNSERVEDEIIIVAMSDNRGHSYLLHTAQGVDVKDGVYCENEAEMLRELISKINDLNPDVIEGHNIYSFDLPYIMDRCAFYGIDFAVGRDGTVARTYKSMFRAAERIIDYPVTHINGRAVIDTFFAVASFDAVKRKMANHSLKESARFFGLAKEDREYVDGSEISKVWKEDPERLLRYALDDVYETLRLSEQLVQSTFYLTQIIPNAYEKIARTGSGGKIEALFLREYLRQGAAVPQPEDGKQQEGGYAGVFLRGIIGPVTYADVNSLYPSIMLNFGIQPERDTLKIFPGLLQALTDLRFEWQSESKKRTGDEKVRFDAMQNAAKIMINSFYGALGYRFFLFNDFSEADRVATTGQKILKRMVSYIEEDGGIVIECDTDGILFVPPENIRGEEQEKAYVESLTDKMPEGIIIGFDGRAEKMLSYRKKNYVLKEYDGTFKFKGSSLISRGQEGFLLEFTNQAIKLLFDGDVVGIRRLFQDVTKRLYEKKYPVELLAKSTTLHKDLDEYLNGVENDGAARSAPYELGLKLRDQGAPIRKGDKVTYFMTGDKKTVSAWENAKLLEEFDGDYNAKYYIGRLEKAIEKFKKLFSEEDWVRIFFSKTITRKKVIKPTVDKIVAECVSENGKILDPFFEASLLEYLEDTEVGWSYLSELDLEQ